MRTLASCFALLVACGGTTTSPSDTGSSGDTSSTSDSGEMDMGPGDDTGPLDTAPVDSGDPSVHVVTVTDFSYSPADLTIKVGESVEWRWVKGTHTVTSGTGCIKAAGFDSGQHTAPYTFKQTFSTAGRFDYFCDYKEHCTMRKQVGSVTVE